MKTNLLETLKAVDPETAAAYAANATVGELISEATQRLEVEGGVRTLEWMLGKLTAEEVEVTLGHLKREIGGTSMQRRTSSLRCRKPWN